MPDIRPVHVEVLGVHRVYTRLLVVEIQVESEPPRRWAEAFNRFQEPRGANLAFKPRLEGDVVSISPSDDELEMWVQAVERRIRHVNKRMAEELKSMTPQPQRAARVSQAVAQDGFSADVRARILEARRLAAGGGHLGRIPVLGLGGAGRHRARSRANQGHAGRCGTARSHGGARRARGRRPRQALIPAIALQCSQSPG
ncbi:MAG: hypothetical protein FJ100_20325 [Deltaproteobacteria bacterium]|nr:hypothetical protein [Deltaproteobacteria bacterium]